MSKMEKSEKVTLLATIVLIGFVAGVIYHYILGYYLSLTYPFNTFLFEPNMFFGDFNNLTFLIKDFTPFKSVNIWLNYFPLAYILLFPFTFIKNKIFSYLIFLTIFLSFWIYTNIKVFTCKNLNKLENFQNIFIITTISYPLLVLIDRGNFDMMLLILMFLFVDFFREKKYLLSSLIIAVINAITFFNNISGFICV